MVFGFFGRKRPALKLEPRQEIEIEFISGESRDSFFTSLVQVEKKRFSLRIPMEGTRPYPCAPGDDVIIILMNEYSILSFKAKILERREKEIDILIPDDVMEEKLSSTENDFSVEIPVPVEFRAITTAHLQTAITREVSARGIKIITNLPVPRDTILHIELAIPDSPVVKLKGKVAESRKMPPDNRKSLTEIEFEDIAQKEREMVFRYIMLFGSRRMRKSR